jgi:GT2 family glycosyltransferase
MKKKLAAILACHNRKVKTIKCLESLFSQTPASVRIEAFLYDDGSTDGTSEEVAKRFSDVHIIHGKGDAYWSGGMRSAFIQAIENDFDFYLWLNDDVELFPDAIAKLTSAYDALVLANKNLSVISGGVMDPVSAQTTYAGIALQKSLLPLRFKLVLPDAERPIECDTCLGNVLLIPRPVVQVVGSIGPAYEHSLGDLDYGLRLRGAGGHVYLAPGHVGNCEPNRKPGIWDRANLSLSERWGIVGRPLGFPMRPWFSFVRTHGGILWPLLLILPYWRLFVPSQLTQLIDTRRRSCGSEPVRAHRQPGA